MSHPGPKCSDDELDIETTDEDEENVIDNELSDHLQDP